MSDLTGEVIDGRYQLIRIIASGGMATIYAALDLRLDRNVAVKIMHPHLAQDDQFVSRFIREAKAAASLSHPNIVAVLDQGWNQGGTPCVFIVMELVEGSTLREYLQSQGNLSIEKMLSMIIPVANALAAAHKMGIVHRDIKPENILVSKEGRIKIADFGLARGVLLGNTLTAESSVILGSVSYLSPEQVQRGIADSRSDIYSLGIVIFELLTGQKPYQGDDPVQIAIRHVNDRVPAPSSLLPSLGQEMDSLVLELTEFDPDKRPRDASIVVEKLRALSEKLDPKRRQLSLELDLPPNLIKAELKKKSQRRERELSATAVERKQSETPRQKPALFSRIKKNALIQRSRISKKEKVAREKATPEKKKPSSRVRRNRRIALLIALALGVALWYSSVGPGSRITIPSLAGLTVDQARSEITSLGLNIEIGAREFNEEIAEGKVISSQPAGGGRIDPLGTVSVTVSRGKERYSIPMLQGLKLAIAEEVIKQNKLTLGEVVREFSAMVPRGYIISSDPVAGERVRPKTPVTIVISRGIEKVAIDNYRGKSSDQALNELTEAGFQVELEYAYSEDLPIGAVIKRTPSQNEIDKGSLIILTVSKGSNSVFVPNLFGIEESQAIATLRDLDLKVEVKRVGKKKVKIVTNISPKVGTSLKRGSTITITVG